LYKSLGNYDAVRGIFGSHVGTKNSTKEALEAEERVEYAEALQLYKEVCVCTCEWGNCIT
jgi:DNA-dependent protein kinase catalytic subunit